jgi:DNA-binding IscR family transcriptional regulator
VATTAALGDVWIAMRESMLAVLGSVTLADLAAGDLPASMLEIDPDRVAPETGEQLKSL